MTAKPTVLSTKELTNRKVWFSRPRKNDPDAIKKLGRIRSWVFAPKEPRVVGFFVRRPDIALMFHRKDTFVAFNGFDLYGAEDDTAKVGDGKSGGYIVIDSDSKATDKGACKSLGIRLDDCVLWIGLPVMCADGTTFGLVGDVNFDSQTGRIVSVVVDQGGTANTLLGQRVIPADKILGFKRGIGAKLYVSDDDSDPESLGAIIVDESVKSLGTEGGVAEAAGTATAVVADKAKKVVHRVTPKVKDAASKATSAVGAVASATSEAAANSAKAAKGESDGKGEATSKFGKAASEAAEKGAYATGRQLVRASGMFGRFKDEFTAALNGDDENRKA